MKKLLVSILSLVMILGLAACGGQSKTKTRDGETKQTESEKKEPLHFVFVNPLPSHPIWLVPKNGFETACEELGIKGESVGPMTVSPEEMAQMVDTAVAQDADAIITQGLCPVAPLRNAIEEGLAVILVDADSPDLENRLAYLGKDIDKQAALMYEEVAKVFPADKKIIMSIQCSNFDNEFFVNQNKAVEDAFAKHPGGFELVNTTLTRGDKAVSTDEWMNTFTAYPEVNVCINLVAEGGAACVHVADELGITDDLIIVGVDDTEENLDLLREGKILCTSVVSFWNYGYQATYWLYQHITEGRMPEKVFNDAGTMMVTKDNVDTYEELLKVKVDLPEK